MKFILTRELGRLAKWLRILGFDTVYYNLDNPGTLIIQALRDERIIVTRNQRLPKGRGIKVVSIQSEKIQKQIAQIMGALKINPDYAMMFSRCTLCNSELAGIPKEEVKGRVPEYVFNTRNNFLACPECKRIYWQGSHWGNVQKILEGI